MKKLFLIVCAFLLIGTSSYAQKGSFLIGASSDVGDKPIIFWSLNPTLGYFVTDNLCVGLGFGMASGSWEPMEDYTLKDDSLSISPFLRFYMSDNPVFFHGGISVGSYKSETNDTDFDLKEESKTSTFGIVGGIGYSLRWGKFFVFEPMLALQSSSGNTTTKITNSGVVTESEGDAPSVLNIGLSLGISVQLGKE